jgi:hypothetical protein
LATASLDSYSERESRGAYAANGWSTRRCEPHHRDCVAIAHYQLGRSVLRYYHNKVQFWGGGTAPFVRHRARRGVHPHNGDVQPNLRVQANLASCHTSGLATGVVTRARTALSSPVARIRVAMALREQVRGGRAAQ